MSMARRVLAGLVAVAFCVVVLSGCQDEVKKTKKVKRYEQEPGKMVSPGTEIVE